MINLQRTILRNLDERSSGMCPTGTLWADVGLDEPGTSYSEFKRALDALEQKGQVVVITGEDRQKAKITDAGRARLLEQ
jgi:predicted transcriptional regulator